MMDFYWTHDSPTDICLLCSIQLFIFFCVLYAFPNYSLSLYLGGQSGHHLRTHAPRANLFQ